MLKALLILMISFSAFSFEKVGCISEHGSRYVFNVNKLYINIFYNSGDQVIHNDIIVGVEINPQSFEFEIESKDASIEAKFVMDNNTVSGEISEGQGEITDPKLIDGNEKVYCYSME